MKKLMAGLIAVVLGFCFCVGTLLAADEAAKAPTEFKGKVVVVKDGDAVKSITISGKDKKLEVVLDEKGKGLAALDGKRVSGHGTEADGKLTVVDFKERAEKGKEEKKADEAK